MANKKKSLREILGPVSTNQSEGEAVPSATTTPSAGEEEAGTSPRRRAAPLHSPLLHAPKVTDSPFKAKVLPLPLPITGGEVLLRYEELDTDRCSPSPLNPREQKLLSMDDPEVARIARSIKQEGQREPVLARVIREHDQTHFEVIYGTTRLYIATQLGIKLKAWVGDIPDVDVRRLARAENAERRDLSPWEKGTDLKRMMETVYAGRSQETVAELEGFSQGQLNKLLRVAEVELDVISLLKSPHELSVTSGPVILKLLEEMSTEHRKEVLRKLHGYAPFETAAQLLKQLKTIQAEAVQKAKPMSKRKPLVVERARGKPVMKVTPHREVEGQYKVDLFEFSAEELDALVAHVKQSKGIDKG